MSLYNNVTTQETAQKWMLQGVLLLPLNSRAKFSLIKTIGYKRYQHACNWFVTYMAFQETFPLFFLQLFQYKSRYSAYTPCNKRETIVIVYWYSLTNRLIQPLEIIAQSKIGLRQTRFKHLHYHVRLKTECIKNCTLALVWIFKIPDKHIP